MYDVADEKKPKIREYETGSAGSGSFGMCVDLSRDGKFTASGHQNGAIYIFNNDTGRILYSLSGTLPQNYHGFYERLTNTRPGKACTCCGIFAR